ncbi:hypothetical protein ACFP2T_00040 [Plantactinospora solaniradicis]|uniref:Lipoprotein n=1 Tax=Plantactinospora solaniradicis TaxID=1723736 RepID=A0ABW1K266_9ACTN
MILMVAACGGDNAAGGSEPPSTNKTVDTAEILNLGKQLAQCYRDNGIAEMPEPYLEDGKLQLPADRVDALQTKYSEAKMNQVEDACKDIASKLPQGSLGGGSENDPKVPGPGDVEALRKYSQCMRDNGVPEWPDPNAEGKFALKGTGLATENSQRMSDAIAKCKQYWSGAIVGA